MHLGATVMARVVYSDDRTRPPTTMPGINFVTSLTIVAGAVGINRFKTVERFAVGVGVIPSRRNSASTC